MVVALMVRLSFVVWWQTSQLPAHEPFKFPDSESYWELGKQIAAGEDYEFRSPQHRVFRTPGYPLLLAGMFRIAGTNAPPITARLLGAVIGTFTVGAVYWLAKRTFNSTSALVAAGMAAVYPGAVAISGLVLAEGLFTLWMFLQLILWTYAIGARYRDGISRDFPNDPGVGPYPFPKRVFITGLMSGIAAGLATLTRPSWLLFTPFAIIACLLVCRDRRRHALLGLAMLAGLLSTMSPWWIRNWQVTHHFVPTTLQVGASLYDGLHAKADGSSEMSFITKVEPQFQADSEKGQHDSVPISEYQFDRHLRMAALCWAMENPTRVIELAAVKFARMWNFWPNEASFRSWPLRLAVLGTYTPVMILALAGVWIHRHQPFVVLILTLPAIYLTLLHIVFVSSLRYRQPAMLTLIVLAAAAVVACTTGSHRVHASSRSQK